MAGSQHPITVHLAPYLEGDLDGRVHSYYATLGRWLASYPDKQELLAVRELTAAKADRAAGESAYGHQSAGGQWIIALRCFDDLIGGYLERLPAPEERGLRERVLLRVAERPARPTEIADEFDRGLPQISKILTELRDSGLIEVQAEAVVGDGRSRLYRLTAQGRAELRAAVGRDETEARDASAVLEAWVSTPRGGSGAAGARTGPGRWGVVTDSNQPRTKKAAAKKAPGKKGRAKKAPAKKAAAKKAPAKKAAAKKAPAKKAVAKKAPAKKAVAKKAPA